MAVGRIGPAHATVAMSSFCLGLVLTAKGNYDEGKSMYAASLRIQEQNLGPKAPEVARTLEEFAKLLRKMKSNQEAWAMEARAKSIRAEAEYTVKVNTAGRH